MIPMAEERCPKSFGVMIMKICTRFSLHPRFYGYTFREDFVSEAIIRCISHSLDRIDLTHPKCNPFSYLTQTAYNVFRQKIKSEKRFAQTKMKLREQFLEDNEDFRPKK